MKAIICEGVAVRTDLSRVLEKAQSARHLRVGELPDGNHDIWVDRFWNCCQRGGKCTWAMVMRVRQAANGVHYELTFEIDNVVIADIFFFPVLYLCAWMGVGWYYVVQAKPIPALHVTILTALLLPGWVLYGLFQTLHVLGWGWSKKALLSLLADTESSGD
jgi:hypothetical protein